MKRSLFLITNLIILFLIAGATMPRTSFSPGYDSVLGYNTIKKATPTQSLTPKNTTNETRNHKANLIATPSPTPTPRHPKVLGTFTLIGPPLPSQPVNKSGTIMIPKISVNSPIVWDVTVNNKAEYNKALNAGVAHALGTPKPSEEIVNSYFFAHSTADERNIARYAAVFTKLHELKVSRDTISIFYNDKRYDYLVIDKTIVSKFDTSVLTKSHTFSSITLQTCDPPGQPINRLLVTGKLIGVYDE